MLRRQLVGSLAALAALTTAKNSRAQDKAATTAVPAVYDSFEEWHAAAMNNSLEFLRTPAGMKPTYLIPYLALWGAAMPRDHSQWKTGWSELAGANSRLEFNTLAAGRPFVVSAFRMAPGCLLPAHCHPGGGGITLCLEGSLTLEHYNLDPDAPGFRETGSEASVRYESSTLLTPERYTSFTPTMSNLHQLRAGPEGATGVDLVVQWEGSGEFSFLKFNQEQDSNGDEIGSTLTGVWSGMNIAEAYA